MSRRSCEHGMKAPRHGPRAASAAGRTLLVLFFCAGVAFLGLLSGGDFPEARARYAGDPMLGYYPGREMPRYPGTQELPAGSEGSVGDTKVRMSFFATEDEPAKVARFYANHWHARQLFVTEDVTHQGGVVSAVDPAGGTVYQVLITVQGERRTMVFPSLTRSPLRATVTGAKAPVVPLYPGSRAVVDLGSGDQGRAARVSLSTNDGTLEENLAHYAGELAAAGYQREVPQQPEALGKEQRVLLFRKEGSEVTVNLTALAEKRTRVHLMEVGSGE